MRTLDWKIPVSRFRAKANRKPKAGPLCRYCGLHVVMPSVLESADRICEPCRIASNWRLWRGATWHIIQVHG